MRLAPRWGAWNCEDEDGPRGFVRHRVSVYPRALSDALAPTDEIERANFLATVLTREEVQSTVESFLAAVHGSMSDDSRAGMSDWLAAMPDEIGDFGDLQRTVDGMCLPGWRCGVQVVAHPDWGADRMPLSHFVVTGFASSRPE